MYKIVFAGGGTAGHIMPNVAIIDELQKRGNALCYYVGGDSMERDICKTHNIEFYRIPTVKLRRDEFFKNLSILFKLRRCVKEARLVLNEIKPDVIFSKGGYCALPVILAAKDIPVIAHESDCSFGLVTKICKRKAEKLLCSFKPLAQKTKNAEYVGVPLRREIFNGKKVDLGFTDDKPVLLVVGGSLGATTLNSAVKAALPQILELFNVVHVCGKNKIEVMPCKGYVPIEFSNAMPDLYATADFALTRGGANALAELIALGKPLLCVPLEKASRGDQIENAEYYKSLDVIDVLRERELTTENLIKRLSALLDRSTHYKNKMKDIQLFGTDKIADIILSVATNRNTNRQPK